MSDKFVVELDHHEFGLLSEWLAVVAGESKNRSEDHRLMDKITKAAHASGHPPEHEHV